MEGWALLEEFPSVAVSAPAPPLVRRVGGLVLCCRWFVRGSAAVPARLMWACAGCCFSSVDMCRLLLSRRVLGLRRSKKS